MIFYRDMQHILSSTTIRIIFLSAALSALVYGQNAKAPAWYALDSKTGGFSVKFPQKPKFESEAMLGGAVTSNTYTYSVGDDFAFVVSYFDMAGTTQDDSTQRFETMAK